MFDCWEDAIVVGSSVVKSDFWEVVLTTVVGLIAVMFCCLVVLVVVVA